MRILTQSVNLLLIVTYLSGLRNVEFHVYKSIALWKASDALRYSPDVKYLNASNANITLSSRRGWSFYHTQRTQGFFRGNPLFFITIVYAKNYYNACHDKF